ncbi:putative Zinc finger protein SHOOT GRAVITROPISM 5 [Helianthus annuus]|nr:putative Zinc finger protein SHOOT GRAVITROPISM 5 [Helianthus annuus]KAJ0440500.1 putative Zinc finger protein SHOOT GRAVITROPISM 5 [Helianthus annuus]KAJ0458640.1 putative Zinc finger protein SHOOT GRAVITROPISM 5 [Helianthus annuus]
MEDDHRELQLLPTPPHTRSIPYSWQPNRSDSTRYRSDNFQFPLETAGPAPPPLDLQLSISLRPIQQPETDYNLSDSFNYKREDKKEDGKVLEVVKWQAADQVRIASMEKAYAERVREMTKREMELAQSEFSRARHMWERAREEVERVEKMKERATRRIDSSCMEITCQACRQKFRH